MATIYRYKDKDTILTHILDMSPNPDHFRMHSHTTVELYCFLRGKGVFHVEGSAYPMEPGDLLLLAPAEAHCIELDYSQPYERIVLNFNPSFFQALDPENLLIRSIFDRKFGTLNLYRAYEFSEGGSAQYFRAMMEQEGEPRLNLMTGLMNILNQLSRIHAQRSVLTGHEPETPEYRIIRYINQNLNKHITLDLLCKQFYTSKSQLCRMIKHATGTSVGHYITVKRLTKAQQLLLAGEQPTHVFSRCGFNDYSVFYRAYVKHFGHAPTAQPQTA